MVEQNPLFSLTNRLMATNGISGTLPPKTGERVPCDKCGRGRKVIDITHPLTKQPHQVFGECNCSKKAWQLEKDKFDAQERERRRDLVADRFGGLELPEAFRGKTIDNFEALPGNREAYELVKRFILTLPARLQFGHGLILSGPCGTGKTHLGAAIANETNRRGRAAIHADTNGLLERIKGLWGVKGDGLARLQSAIQDADLLVLEDLGQEVATKQDTAYLFNWLNARYAENRATIITTNMSLAQLRERYSEAILSRLRERNKAVVLTGEDYRTRLKVEWWNEPIPEVTIETRPIPDAPAEGIAAEGGCVVTDLTEWD